MGPGRDTHPIIMVDTDTIRRNWLAVLSVVYREADWSKITGGGRRRSTDVFQHRLLVAAKQPTVPQAVRKLCHGLSLQGPPIDASVLDELREHERTALRLLDEENVYLTLKAKQTVDNYYGDDSDDDVQTTDLTDFIEL